MDNASVAAAFVDGSTSAGGSNFYCQGDKLYSYGEHYVLAIRLKCGDFLQNLADYSVTTNRHHTHFRRAVTTRTWQVTDCDITNIHDDVADSIFELLVLIGPAKGNLEEYVKRVQLRIDYYTKFCAKFKIRAKISSLFADCPDQTIKRMHKGCLYSGKSTYKLFRKFAEVQQVAVKLLGE